MAVRGPLIRTAAAVLLLLLAAGCVHQGGVDHADAVAERAARFTAANTFGYDSVLISEVSLTGATGFQADNGDFPRWIELENRSREPVRIGRWRLRLIDADGVSTLFSPLPDVIMDPGSFRLLVFTPERQRLPVPALRIAAPFPPDTSIVELLDGRSQVVDRFTLPAYRGSKPDASAVRDPLLPAAVRLTGKPTPGLGNREVVEPPGFSADSARRGEAVTLEVTAEGLPEDYRIRYTVVHPGEPYELPTLVTGRTYEQPLVLEETALILARVYAPGGASSDPASMMFVPDEGHELPVLALTRGAADTQLEYLRRDRAPYSMKVSLEAEDQELLYISADDVLIPNIFFTGPAKEITHHRHLVLSRLEHPAEALRYGLERRVMDGLGLPAPDSRPVELFLDGQRMGSYLLSERADEYFFSDRLEVRAEHFDIAEGSNSAALRPRAGDIGPLAELIELTEAGDAAFEQRYERYGELLSIDSFIDFIICETFFTLSAGQERPYLVWRDRAGEALWRFLPSEAVAAAPPAEGPAGADRLDRLIEAGREDLISRLFRELIRNREFFDRFAARFRKLLAAELAPERLAGMLERTYPELSAAAGGSEDALEAFALERSAQVREHLRNFERAHRPAVPSLIENGSFIYDDISMWDISRYEEYVEQRIVPSEAEEGRMGYVRKLQVGPAAGPAAAFVYEGIPLQRNTLYSLTFNLRSLDELGAGEYIEAVLDDTATGEQIASRRLRPQRQWTSVQINAVYRGAAIDTARLRFVVDGLQPGSSFYLDDIALQAGDR